MNLWYWTSTVVALLTVLSTATAEPPTVYRGDSNIWVNSPVPDLGPPTTDTITLGDPFGSVFDPPTRSGGNGNGNGNGGNGNGNGERQHIRDNSFFIEEAYNQEPGVAQHIFNWVGLWDREFGERRDFLLLYILELPLGSQRHQFSFSLPFVTFFDHPDGEFPEEQGGVGDIFLNYRYQLLTDTDMQPAIAPRFSLILPTGDDDRGLGTGELGYFFNLPISKELDPFAFHFNAGFTYIPEVSGTLLNGLPSAGRDFRAYNLGFSAIWLASYDLNFLVEFFALWTDEVDDLGFREHTTRILVNPGFRYALFTEGELQWVIGVSVPVGLTPDAADIGVFGYMSVEHPFKKQANGSGGS